MKRKNLSSKYESIMPAEILERLNAARLKWKEYRDAHSLYRSFYIDWVVSLTKEEKEKVNEKQPGFNK